VRFYVTTVLVERFVGLYLNGQFLRWYVTVKKTIEPKARSYSFSNSAISRRLIKRQLSVRIVRLIGQESVFESGYAGFLARPVTVGLKIYTCTP
jgi:hypothetical protein